MIGSEGRSWIGHGGEIKGSTVIAESPEGKGRHEQEAHGAARG